MLLYRFMGYETLRNKMVDKDGKLTQTRTVLCGLGFYLVKLFELY